MFDVTEWNWNFFEFCLHIMVSNPHLTGARRAVIIKWLNNFNLPLLVQFYLPLLDHSSSVRCPVTPYLRLTRKNLISHTQDPDLKELTL